MVLEFTKDFLKVVLIPGTNGSFDFFCELVNAPDIATFKMIATLPGLF